MEKCMWFEGFTEIQNGLHRWTSLILVGAKTQIMKSEIIKFLQSHHPPYDANVQVILLKFKMATTSRLFFTCDL